MRQFDAARAKALTTIRVQGRNSSLVFLGFVSGSRFVVRA
jgi:hypothetical protein